MKTPVARGTEAARARFREQTRGERICVHALQHVWRGFKSAKLATLGKDPEDLPRLAACYILAAKAYECSLEVTDAD